MYIKDNPTVATCYFYYKTVSVSHRTGNGLPSCLVQCSIVACNTVTLKVKKLNKLSNKNLKIMQMLFPPLSHLIVGHFGN